MANPILTAAQQYLRAGLSVLPTKADKRPALPAWKQLTQQRLPEAEGLFNTAPGLGIICGAVSGGLEVIDVDTKNAKDPEAAGELVAELFRLIEDNLPERAKTLPVAKTPSGGYHIYYRCSTISGNQKLAQRSPGSETLIETRGEGGYVLAAPTPGYNFTRGDALTITEIRPEERAILLSICRSFSELAPEESAPKEHQAPKYDAGRKAGELSPFEDYTQRGDVIGLLEAHGWEVVGSRSGLRINLKRPGNTSAAYSGNFHTRLRTLRVFSTSTDFTPEKSYSAAQVYALLECGGSNKLAYRRLLEEGYGTPLNGEKVAPTRLDVSQITVTARDHKGERTVATPGSQLKTEHLPSGGDVIISAPGPEAEAEVLSAIALINEEGKRAYIREGSGVEMRDYRYRMQAIINAYNEKQKRSGSLTDRERDSLIEEVVKLSTTLGKMDKERLLTEFQALPAIQDLGITAAGLLEAEETLRKREVAAKQARLLKDVLSDAEEFGKVGEIAIAAQLLSEKLGELTAPEATTTAAEFLTIPTEEEISSIIAVEPDGVATGYNLDSGSGGMQELELPAGALSIIAARTSHRKTSLMMNISINVARRLAAGETPGEVYFFSYEESREAILMKLLNIDMDISLEGESNLKTLRRHYRNRSGLDATATAKKSAFFAELISSGRLRVNYSKLDVDSLIGAIRAIQQSSAPAVVLIDYIQLLRINGKYGSKQLELQEICTRLRRLAVETGLPIILGAQFNRTVNQEGDIESSAIREAGDIEQEADLVLGLWDRRFTKEAGGDKAHKDRRGEAAVKEDALYIEVLKGRSMGAGAYGVLPYDGNTWKIKDGVTERRKEAERLKGKTENDPF